MANIVPWQKRVNWKVLALFPLVPIGIAVALAPTIMHALDFGESTITVAALARGERPSSSNVRIDEGRPLYQSAYQLTTTRDGSVERVEQFVPVVPMDWQPGQPVPLLVHIERGIAYDSNVDPGVARAQSFAGIARTYLWEGVGSSEREIFRQNLHLTLADDVLLLDLDPSKYLFYLYSVAPIFAALVMGYIAMMMIRMEREGHATDVEFERKFEESRRMHEQKRAAAAAEGRDEDEDDEDDEDDDDDEDEDDD